MIGSFAPGATPADPPEPTPPPDLASSIPPLRLSPGPESRSAPGRRPPRGRWRGFALVCLLVIAGGGLAVFLQQSGGPAAQTARGQPLAGTHFETPGALARVRAVAGGAGTRLVVGGIQGLTTPAAGGHYSVWLYNSVRDKQRLGPLRIRASSTQLALPSDARRYRSVHVIFQSGAGLGGPQVLALSGPNPMATHRGASPSSQLTVPDPIWADEFSGTSLDPQRWRIFTGGGGHGNNDLEDYTRSGVSVAGGNLKLTAQRTGGKIDSGAIDSLDRVTARYGLIEADIQVPAGTGLWPTFWLEGTDLPSVGWPASGEIDTMEILDSEDSTDNGSIHTASQLGSTPYVQINRHRCACDLASGFHVYGIDWSPNRIQFMLDGKIYATTTRAAVEAQGGRWTFNKPFFVLLSLAVGGTGDGNPTAATPFPATMSVNWVRVYANS